MGYIYWIKTSLSKYENNKVNNLEVFKFIKSHKRTTNEEEGYIIKFKCYEKIK